MSKLIKKLKEKKKKDPAHFTKKQLEQRDKKLLNDSIKEMNKKEKEEKKALIFLKKELKKYQTDKKELLKLKDAINDIFKVSETSTAAAEYGIAALYFDALEIHRLPKNYYPLPHADQHELFTPGEDYHYWLWNFQINTQTDRHGHTIPDRPGTTKEYVIKEYPHTPTYANGARVDAFEDHITEIGVHGKPHKIFPFIQSKIEKNIIIKILLNKILSFILKRFIR